MEELAAESCSGATIALSDQRDNEADDGLNDMSFTRVVVQDVMLGHVNRGIHPQQEVEVSRPQEQEGEGDVQQKCCPVDPAFQVLQ